MNPLPRFSGELFFDHDSSGLLTGPYDGREFAAPIVPYLELDASDDPLMFRPGRGVTLPQSVNKWCGLRFTAGTCQGVVSRRIVPDPNCGPLDIALVLDRSGSMATALGSVVSELLALRLDLERASGGDFRVALVTFDFGIYVEQTFTADFDLFAAKMSAVQAGAGSLQPRNLKYPEASDEALRTVVAGLSASSRTSQGATLGSAPPNGVQVQESSLQIGDFNVPWRQSARKIAVLVTDDLPAGLDDDYVPGVDDANADAVAHLAKTKNVRISSVYTPTGTPSHEALVTQIMENYALVSDGLFLRTQAAGQGAGAALSDVINSCGGLIEETFVEYCTDDLVIPVSCCGDAACVWGDGVGKKVGVFRVSSPGPINAVWFAEKSNPAAFGAMCRTEQRLWGRIDGTAPVALNPEGALSSADIVALSQFNIPVPLGREFWLPRAAFTFEVAVVLDDGVSLEADLAVVH